MIEQTVQRLVADWASLPEERRPWATWVLLWGPIETHEALEVPYPTVPLLGAWFLTDSGYVRRDVWSYFRFRAIQYSPTTPYPLANPVAVLEIAPYRDSLALYAAGHFGPRHAYGMRTELDANGQLTEHRFWVS